MGFEDAFADVKFPSVTIDASGTVHTGQAGDPPPATSDKSGQQSASPTDAGAKDTGNPQPDIDKGKVDDKSTEKPLPYDQDPKWKKARAAEARLETILKEHNFLDVEELVD